MKLTTTQQQLVTDNINFAYYWANRWVRTQGVINREELISIACEALCKAALLFDPERGCGFVSFSRRHINHTLSKAVRDKLCHDRIENNARELQAFSLQKEAEYSVEDNILCDAVLQDAIDDLPSRRKAIVIDYYLNQLNYKEIALKHRLTTTQVKFALREARKTMREKIT